MKEPRVFCYPSFPPSAWAALGSEAEALRAQAAWAWREGRGLDQPPEKTLASLSPFESVFAVEAMERLPAEETPAGTVRWWMGRVLALAPADPQAVYALLAAIEEAGSWGAASGRIPDGILREAAGRIVGAPSGLLFASAGRGWRGEFSRATRLRAMWRRSGDGIRILAEAWRGRMGRQEAWDPWWRLLAFPETLRTVLLAPDRIARLRRWAARGRAMAAAAWGEEAASWLPEGLIVLPRRGGRKGPWAWDPGSGLRSGGGPW